MIMLIYSNLTIILIFHLNIHYYDLQPFIYGIFTKFDDPSFIVLVYIWLLIISIRVIYHLEYLVISLI